MARQYVINSETMVLIRSTFEVTEEVGGDSSNPPEPVTINSVLDEELGLTDSPIKITPNYYHRDIYVDDYGDKVPAEVLVSMTDCIIEMTLVHYDPNILSFCISNSMASQVEGTMQNGSLVPMGGGVPISSTTGNNFYLTLVLQPAITTQGGQLWVFPTAYLAERPFVYPIGTERSLVQLRWRAIPYAPIVGNNGMASGEILSTGAVIWTHEES